MHNRLKIYKINKIRIGCIKSNWIHPRNIILIERDSDLVFMWIECVSHIGNFHLLSTFTPIISSMFALRLRCQKQQIISAVYYFQNIILCSKHHSRILWRFQIKSWKLNPPTYCRDMKTFLEQLRRNRDIIVKTKKSRFVIFDVFWIKNMILDHFWSKLRIIFQKKPEF